MKPAPAKATESTTLEEVGRATLQIVHDLKNQLNGLKLYATFLRKRFEQDNRTADERETLAKLIWGLDRAARDMTVLVKYAQPLEIRTQTHVDLRKIINEVVRETTSYAGAGASVLCDAPEAIQGDFDAVSLSQAFAAITEHALGGGGTKRAVTIRLRSADSPDGKQAVIEWVRESAARPPSSNQSFDRAGNVRRGLATKIIDSHGGRVEFDAEHTRAFIPLSQKQD